MKFRPCIDLHQGHVKQIVGKTLNESETPKVNFETNKSAAAFARLYQHDGLTGGHVIMLGPGNTEAAEKALETYPGGLQIGGGINDQNAAEWLEKGAEKVIVTSFLFVDNQLSAQRLEKLTNAVGRERLVLDLSCKQTQNGYQVACNRWQTLTDISVEKPSLTHLAKYCSEFLIHAVDVEGKQAGVAEDLVALLSDITPIPTTYAGGIHTMSDIKLLAKNGKQRLDYTVGSALDIFGGTGIAYEDLVKFNQQQSVK